MPYLTVNTHKLHYTDTPSSNSKEKATLIFIHGLGSTQNFYTPVLPFLSGYRCITFDTYGAGRSKLNDPPGEHSIATIARDVVSLLEELKVQKAIAVGYSMGGMVPTHLAATYPDRFIAGICIGPVHPSAAAAEIFKKRVPTVRKDGMDAMANTIPNGATGTKATSLQKAFIREMILSQEVEGYVLNCQAIEHATAPNYSGVKCPILIIAGDEDRSAPVEGCKYVLGELGSENKTLEILSGVGHWLCIEESEKIGGLVKTFCDSVI